MAAVAAINRICPLAVCFLAVASSILFASPVVSGAVGKGAFVKKTVAAHAIVIFSKSYCPYCRRAKAVFSDLKKVPYVVELDQRDDGGDIQDALHTIVGRRTVPQVFIHGKHLGGSDDTIEAYENGELAKMLGITNNVSNDDL